MTEVLCPVQCVRSGCPDPDFLEKNGTWLLTVIAAFIGCVGTMFTFFLKSRCKQISCCGMNCVRDVVPLKANDVEITSSKA